MNELNKNQLILLALLVSFVTSIATGIVTVALMEQAPQSVTQTINKVITQTIEKVVTEKAPAAVIQASEDDLIALAFEKNTKGVVKIRLGLDGDIVGRGIVVSANGIIVSDINPAEFADEAKYFGVFPDGKEFSLTISRTDKNGLTFFTPQLGDDKKNPYKTEYLSLGDSNRTRVGQAVLVISSSPGEPLQKGIISGLVRESAGETATSTTATSTNAEVSKENKPIILIKLSISLSRENSGSPLVKLDGELIGITIYREGIRAAVPSNLIKESLSLLALPKKSTSN